VDLPKINLDVLRTIPVAQKAAALVIGLGFIGVVFHFSVFEPKSMLIAQLDSELRKLDKAVQTLTIKVKHLDELQAANQQLEIELAKKRERLPPKEEAVMLLKQLTDLGVKLGLDIKLWKPKKEQLDSTKMFVKMPVNVEVAGGFHTVALFFDRVAKLPRTINVSNLKMGAPKFEEGRAVIQTAFDLTAFAAP
jgi:type IV pilus assembly protein PilO